MYESPIKIIQQLHEQIQMDFENNIMKAVQSYAIDVNKEELLKALKYDREQYNKGYKDGTRKTIENILQKIDEIKRKPIELCYDVPLYESIIQIIKEGLK